MPACNQAFSRQDSHSSELVLFLLHHAQADRPAAPPSRTFVRDVRAFFKEENAIKRDEIAGRRLFALSTFQRPRDKKLRLADVKEMFLQMKEHA